MSDCPIEDENSDSDLSDILEGILIKFKNFLIYLIFFIFFYNR